MPYLFRTCVLFYLGVQTLDTLTLRAVTVNKKDYNPDPFFFLPYSHDPALVRCPLVRLPSLVRFPCLVR